MHYYTWLVPRFPGLIADRRVALGLSTAELAARCTLTTDQIEALERGRFLPSPAQAFSLGQALEENAVMMRCWAIEERRFQKADPPKTA